MFPCVFTEVSRDTVLQLHPSSSESPNTLGAADSTDKADIRVLAAFFSREKLAPGRLGVMETFGRAVFGGLGRPICSLRTVPTHRPNAGCAAAYLHLTQDPIDLKPFVLSNRQPPVGPRSGACFILRLLGISFHRGFVL